MQNNGFYETYKKKTRHLDEIERCLRREREEIPPINQELNAAKISVLKRQIDEALVAGQVETVERLKAELAGIEAEPAKVESQRHAIDKKLAEVIGDRKLIAESVIQSAFGNIQAKVQKAFSNAEQAAENGWAELKALCNEFSINVPTVYQQSLWQPWRDLAGNLGRVNNWNCRLGK